MSMTRLPVLHLCSAPLNVDPPHVVLQREFARRQGERIDAPGTASTSRAPEQPRAEAGVYAIRNRATGRVYVSGDLDVDMALACDRAALKSKQHRNDALQDEWNWYGEDAFSFDVVARVEPRADGKTRGKLAQMLEAMREQLRSYGTTGYNHRVRVPF